MEGRHLLIILGVERSGSTTLVRCFEKSGYTIFHEPSMKPHCLREFPNLPQEWWNDKTPSTFADTTKNIIEALLKGNVLIKDMVSSFTANPQYIWLIDELLSSPPVSINVKIDVIFLARHPAGILTSLSKFPEVSLITYKIDGTYKRMYHIYNALKTNMKYRGTSAYIINVEKLFSNFKENMPNLSNVIPSLKNINILTEWESKPTTYNGDDMHESKKRDHFWKWHGNALSSTYIKPLNNHIEDLDKLLTDNSKLAKIYEESLQCYNIIITYAIN